MNLEQQLLLDEYGFIFEDDQGTDAARILRADLLILKNQVRSLPLVIEGLKQNPDMN